MASKGVADSAGNDSHTGCDVLADAASSHTSASFRVLLKQLVLAAAVPANAGATPKASALNPSQMRDFFEHLADPDFTSNQAHHAQLGAALTAMRLGGLDATPDALACASEVFLARSIRVGEVKASDSTPSSVQTQPDSSQDELYDGCVDMVGTGGDGHDTFNVSTTAAMVAAGVRGVRVCKVSGGGPALWHLEGIDRATLLTSNILIALSRRQHGARASSSTSGSADLLVSLEIPLPSLSPTLLIPLIPKLSFSFLFAQLYHPSLGPLAPIRRTLAFPTIFNVLGPLINPAKPARCILGVHSAYLGPIFAEALKKRGTQRAWVVCGREGLDEISPEGETDVWELRDGRIEHFVVKPASFGIASHPLTHVGSHSSAENAAIVARLFERGGEANLPEAPLEEPLSLAGEIGWTSRLPPVPAGTRLRALADYTLLQAAALLYVAGKASNLRDAAELSRRSMNSGAAMAALDAFRAAATEAIAREGGQGRG